MATGLHDIHDRADVLHPDEIAAGEAQCKKSNITTVNYFMDGKPTQSSLKRYVAMLQGRWQRAVETSRMIDAMRAGYCTITPNTAPASSDARH